MFQDPTFWTAVAFVIFLALTLKPLGKAITGGLDSRAASIRAELDEAQRLREEAQKTLAEYKRKQRDAAKETEELIAHAKAEAKRMSEQAETDLRAAIKRREESALEKIAQAENTALQEVRGQAVDIAIAATRKLLAENLDQERADRMLENSIKEVGAKLH